MIDLAILETEKTKKNRNNTGKLKNPFDQRKEGEEHNQGKAGDYYVILKRSSATINLFLEVKKIREGKEEPEDIFFKNPYYFIWLIMP